MTKLERYNTIQFALRVVQQYARKEIRDVFKEIKRLKSTNDNKTTKEKDLANLYDDINCLQKRKRIAEVLLSDEFEVLRKNSKKLKSLEL